MHALVTGASRGLGLAMAQELAGRGWTVVCVARDAVRLDHAVAGIRSFGGSAEAVVADVTSEADVVGLFDRLTASASLPQLVVVNAGVFIRGTVTEAREDDWATVMDVNVNGAHRVAQAAVRSMRRLPVVDGTRGHVVFVNSGAGVQPYAAGASYTASKHALLGLSGALREEVAPEGIAVTDLVVRAAFSSEISDRAGDRLPASTIGDVLGRIIDVPGEAYIERIDIARLGVGGFERQARGGG